MKTKLEMAHEWYLKHSEIPSFMNTEVEMAWDYADLMQAEADKREKEEAAQRRKEIREMLNAPNTFVEREGQHFDDFCSDEIQAQRDDELYGAGFLKVTYDSDGVKYEILDPKTISVCSSNIGLDSQVLKEWQPDWSQAPADACCWFIGGKSWDVKPYWSKYIPCYKNEETQTTWQGDGMIEAPSFGYTGDWRESLRKRPK